MLKTILASILVALGTHAVSVPAQPDADVAAFREELKGRRARLMEKLGSGSIAILWSAPARVYSRDVDYEYRQDSDLLYLTGIKQPDTTGYPSIVGSGPNATTLHYSASSCRMNEGDLLLVDAAANYKGLTGDITRTYP